MNADLEISMTSSNRRRKCPFKNIKIARMHEYEYKEMAVDFKKSFFSGEKSIHKGGILHS